MRRLLLSLMLALIPTNAAGGVRWGAVGVTQWSRLTGAPAGDLFGVPWEADVRWSPSPGVGAVLEIGLRGSWAIEAEAQLCDQRDEANFGQFFFGGTGYESRAIGRLTSIAVPLRAMWRPRPRVRLGAGPEVRYLARATTTPVLDPILPGTRVRPTAPAGVTANIFEDFPATLDVTSNYRRWGLGVSLGAGYAWPMGEHEGRLDVRWVRGFTDLTRTDDETRAWEGVQASLGVLW